MIRRLVRTALRNLLTEEISNTKDEQEVASKKESPEVMSSTTYENELQKYRRKADAYFFKIESVLSERDRWKSMFYEQGNGHHSAQVLLEVKLMETRELLSRAVAIVNEYRAQANQPLLEAPYKELTDPPIGSSKEFEALLLRLHRQMPRETDHLNERAMIEAT